MIKSKNPSHTQYPLSGGTAESLRHRQTTLHPPRHPLPPNTQSHSLHQLYLIACESLTCPVLSTPLYITLAWSYKGAVGGSFRQLLFWSELTSCIDLSRGDGFYVTSMFSWDKRELLRCSLQADLCMAHTTSFVYPLFRN